MPTRHGLGAILDDEATHEAASIRRCWSTWNLLCTFLFTADLIAANAMSMVGRPKLPKALRRSLPADAVTALLAAVSEVPQRPLPRRHPQYSSACRSPPR